MWLTAGGFLLAMYSHNHQWEGRRVDERPWSRLSCKVCDVGIGVFSLQQAKTGRLSLQEIFISVLRVDGWRVVGINRSTLFNSKCWNWTLLLQCGFIQKMCFCPLCCHLKSHVFPLDSDPSICQSSEWCHSYNIWDFHINQYKTDIFMQQMLFLHLPVNKYILSFRNSQIKPLPYSNRIVVIKW